MSSVVSAGPRGLKGEKGDKGVGEMGDSGPPGAPGKTPHQPVEIFNSPLSCQSFIKLDLSTALLFYNHCVSSASVMFSVPSSPRPRCPGPPRLWQDGPQRPRGSAGGPWSLRNPWTAGPEGQGGPV